MSDVFARDPDRIKAGGHRGARPIDLHLGEDLVGLRVDALNRPDPRVGNPQGSEADFQPVGITFQVDRRSRRDFDGHNGFRIVGRTARECLGRQNHEQQACH